VQASYTGAGFARIAPYQKPGTATIGVAASPQCIVLCGQRRVLAAGRRMRTGPASRGGSRPTAVTRYRPALGHLATNHGPLGAPSRVSRFIEGFPSTSHQLRESPA